MTRVYTKTKYITLDNYYEDYVEDIKLNELLYKNFETIYKRIEIAIQFESDFKIDTLNRIVEYVKFRYERILKKLYKLKYTCVIEKDYKHIDDFKDTKIIFDYYWKFYYKLIKLQKEYLKNKPIKKE